MVTVEDIKKLILINRDYILNAHNATRTKYYNDYWQQHPEVPWTLLASLVSRNAGYQMSDLARYVQYQDYLRSRNLVPGDTAVAAFLHVAAELLNGLTKPLLEALFKILEIGNFLIFRDVYPALEAYKWAKLAPLKSDGLFAMLTDPEFDCDPFIVDQWKYFYNEALNADWSPDWANDWLGAAIQEHSYSLIINE